MWLSAPVSLTRFQVSKHPPVFLKSDSVTTVPRFPRSGPPAAAFPDVISTIRALRLPASNAGHLCLRPPVPTSLLLRSLPHGGDFRAGPVPFKPRHPRL